MISQLLALFADLNEKRASRHLEIACKYKTVLMLGLRYAAQFNDKEEANFRNRKPGRDSVSRPGRKTFFVYEI